MKKNMEELGEVQLYYIDNNTIEKIEVLFPVSVANEIKKGEAFGLAIEEEGEIRGAVSAAFYPETDHLEVLSIYVAKEARRRHLGATLLLQMIYAVMEETEGELRAVTMSFLENTEGMKAFLEMIGFEMEILKEEGSFFLDRKLLEESRIMEMAGNGVGKDIMVTSLKELSDYELKELYHQLQESETAYISLKELQKISNDYSYVIREKQKEFLACCIITGDKQPVLAQFYAKKGNAKYGTAVLTKSLLALIKEEGDRRLEIPCISVSSIRLLEKLVPGAKKENYIRAVLYV